MASAGLRKELECSICLSLYTDPVTLRCGHNFCRVCIDQHLNIQSWSRVYSCPECREGFKRRPVLKRNITLCNVVENFLFTQPQHAEEITGIRCTYCIHSPVPAVRSCLHCEASLCDNHLKVHSKSAEHVLTDPGTSLENRKCSVHKELLKYYCTKDAICICVSCSLVGEHRGHRVEMLDEASEKKKNKLRNVLQKLITKREKTEERVQSLEEHRRKAQEKASGEAERVTALFVDIMRRLDDLEKRVLSEIFWREEKMSLSLSDVIQKLETKKKELSRKIRNIEELCNMTDPLTVLQEPNTGDLCDPEKGGGDEDTWGHDGGDEDTCDLCDPEKGGGDEDIWGHDKTHDVDVDVISQMLNAGLSDTMTYLQTISPAQPKKYGDDDVIVRTVGVGGQVKAKGQAGAYEPDPADILLDVNTAANYLLISDDLKIATWTEITQDRPKEAERFQDCCQVMSSRGVSSGRHYWDVEISRSGAWRVGMCYPSIDRRGDQSCIGDNNKSWGLYGGQACNNEYIAVRGRIRIGLRHQISGCRVRIYVDYEAGRLSFYELCYPIKLLHTFTATFTEPLHAVLYVRKGYIKISGGAAVRSHHPRRNPPRDW